MPTPRHRGACGSVAGEHCAGDRGRGWSRTLTRRPDAYHPDPRRWRILGVTLVVGFMSLLDVTIVNVALPSMRAGLDTSTGTIQWVVSGYALAFGLTLVAGGRLGDAYGRRRLMVIGLIGFVPSSAAVGLAPRPSWWWSRGWSRASSAGCSRPQNSGLIQQLFRGAERGTAFGHSGPTVSMSSACRSGHRRCDHRAGRQRERLAVAVPGQRPDRAGRAGRDRAPVPDLPPRGPGPRPAHRRTWRAAAGRRGAEPAATRWSGSGRCALPLLAAGRRAGVPVGVRALGAADPADGRPPLLDVALLRELPGTSTGWPSARSTSPGSRACSWCCRCSSRRRSTPAAARRACC